MVESIQSSRLSLVSMDVPMLEVLLAGDCDTAARLLECSIPDGSLPKKSLLLRRLKQLCEDEGVRPWLLRAMIDRTSRRMVGHIGFHSTPGQEHLAEMAPNGVELGYTVFEPFRRQRYATEAAIAMMRWAYTEHNQRCFVLSISPENRPSTAMAKMLGFTERGSMMDEEDGLETYFVRRLDGWPTEWDVCRNDGDVSTGSA